MQTQTRFVCLCFSSYLRHIFSYAYEYWCTGIATPPNSDIIGFWILKNVFSCRYSSKGIDNIHPAMCFEYFIISSVQFQPETQLFRFRIAGRERQFFSSLLPNSLFSRQVYYRSPPFPSKYTTEPNFVRLLSPRRLSSKHFPVLQHSFRIYTDVPSLHTLLKMQMTSIEQCFFAYSCICSVRIQSVIGHFPEFTHAKIKTARLPRGRMETSMRLFTIQRRVQ